MQEQQTELKMRIDKYVNNDPYSTAPQVEIEAFLKGVVVMILLRENRISHVSVYDQAYAGQTNCAVLSDVKYGNNKKWTLSERKRDGNAKTVAFVGSMMPDTDTFGKLRVANGTFCGCVDGEQVAAVVMKDNGEIDHVRLFRNDSVLATINTKGDVTLSKRYENLIDQVNYAESKDAFFRRKAFLHRAARQCV